MHCPASSSPRARAAPHARRTSLLMAWTWSVPVWHRGWRWVTVGVFPKCWPAARGVRGCALGLVNVALANLPAVCVIRITCTMPCRPRSRRLGGRWMPNATGTTAKWRARQRQR